MKTLQRGFKLLPALLLGLSFSGCESTDSGGSVSGSVYYGAGFSDPWYYGDTYDDVDIIVTPPDRPGDAAPPRPTHPIAPVPPAPRPMPMPMPSIPRAPMPRGR